MREEGGFRHGWEPEHRALVRPCDVGDKTQVTALMDLILKVMGTNVRGGPCRGMVVFLSSNTAMRPIRGCAAGAIVTCGAG